MVFSKCFQVQVFASTTTLKGACIASWYLHAASGVPQANQSWLDFLGLAAADLTHKATGSNGGRQHGPLWLHVLSLSRNSREALPEVGVKCPLLRCLVVQFLQDPAGPSLNQWDEALPHLANPLQQKVWGTGAKRHRLQSAVAVSVTCSTHF